MCPQKRIQWKSIHVACLCKTDLQILNHRDWHTLQATTLWRSLKDQGWGPEAYCSKNARPFHDLLPLQATKQAELCNLAPTFRFSRDSLDWDCPNSSCDLKFTGHLWDMVLCDHAGPNFRVIRQLSKHCISSKKKPKLQHHSNTMYFRERGQTLTWKRYIIFIVSKIQQFVQRVTLISNSVCFVWN